MSDDNSTFSHVKEDAVGNLLPCSQTKTAAESPDKSVYKLGHVGWYMHSRLNMDSLGRQVVETESPGTEATDPAQTEALVECEAEAVAMDSESRTPPPTPEMPVLVKKRAANGETLYFCNECPYNSNFKRSVHRHIESVHMGLRSFMCPYCQYKANYMSNIKRHVSSVHDGVRKFACPRCDYRTSDKGHLSSHIKAVHEKLKPFECTECNYHASKRTDLNIHIKTVHEKEKPYQCPYCSYQASKSGNLKRHIKNIHEDPVPPRRTKRALLADTPCIAPNQDSFQAFIKSQVKSILDQVSQHESSEQISAGQHETVLNLTNKKDDIPPSSHSKKNQFNSLEDVMANRDIEISVVSKSD